MMLPLDTRGKITVWDVNGHSTTLNWCTYESWLDIEGSMRAGGAVSITVNGGDGDNFTVKQIQYGQNMLVRGEFEAHK